MEVVPVTPGKIIAVHLSYDSRATQRGRKPTHPSYFLKPASSLAGTGGVAERPAGTELLAFEGEIALVIGTPARSLGIADAWEHVASVTAANDLGLYDLRANDKGSNLRNKGRDGYTPIGPELIDAAGLDPRGIRVRTWVNGQLRQDDTSAGMFFPLEQIIADLSQHLTLETGDVILTGTPAGSSVLSPGDVVEVEVDVPATGQSSGRLVTTVTEGETPFDPTLGSLPSIDDEQRAEAWGSRAEAGLPSTSSGTGNATSGTEKASSGTENTTPGTEEARPESGEARPGIEKVGISAELRAKLAHAPTAGLSAALRRRGYDATSIDGVRANRLGAKIVGTAKTLRFVPGREDLFQSHGGGYNAQKRAFDTVEEGEIIVIEARGERGSGTLGDILALRAKARGAVGVVTDGGVRDYDTVADILPVFSGGPHPAVLGRRHVPWDFDITIACGGATVQPGDIIVGDGDGVIVIPPALAEQIVDEVLAQEDEDSWIAEQVAAGHPIDGLFPMNSRWRAQYEAQKAQQ